MRRGLEDVQELALVFVDALDLDVEHRLRRDADALRPLQPVDQPRLVGLLDGAEPVAEARIVGQGREAFQPLEIADPALAHRLGDQAAEPRVAGV